MGLLGFVVFYKLPHIFVVIENIFKLSINIFESVHDNQGINFELCLKQRLC